MSYQLETSLKDGRDVTVEWNGYIDCDQTGRAYPEFTEPMTVTDDDSRLCESDIPDDWEKLEEACTDHMADLEHEEEC